MENNIIEFVKEQRKVSHANYKKRCEFCGREFFSVRVDAKFCTPLCRVKYFQKCAKDAQESAKNETPDSIVFYTRINELDEEWENFRKYLKDTFGWKKSETLSFKKIEWLADEWNERHQKQISLSRKRVWRGGQYVSKITFSIK